MDYTLLLGAGFLYFHEFSKIISVNYFTFRENIHQKLCFYVIIFTISYVFR